MSITAAAMTPPALPGGLTPRLKTVQLARFHSVSISTVNKWVASGCPVRRLPNGDRRFEPAAVDAWLDQQAEGACEFTAERSRRGVEARSA